METSKKETYWSRFTEDFEARQELVVGKEIIRLVQNELNTEGDLQDVLELGCGTGLYTEFIAGKSRKITATDFSEEMIAKARTKRGHLHNAKFSRADAMDLPFEDHLYDTVFMANLIHVISDPEKSIQESHRVLKPGGTIIITSFAIDEMSFLNKIRMGFRFIKTFGKLSADATKVKTSMKAIEKMLAKNQFRIIKSKLLGNKIKAMYLVAMK